MSDRDAELDEMIHRVDLDALIRLIDDRAGREDWEGLWRLRRSCIVATQQTGRQLWPAATLAQYRLALDAPGPMLAHVFDEEADQFAPGPLSEVAATNHRWADIADDLSPTTTATVLAYERGIRGETVPTLGTLPEIYDIPVNVQPWEPTYPISTYSRDGGVHPDIDMATVSWSPVEVENRTVEHVEDPDVEAAFRQLVQPWTAASTGRAEIATVEGKPCDALAALGVRRARIGELTTADALAVLAWAGASGGAYGRRRGMANGRYSMWWLLAAIGDLSWPPSNDTITELLDELVWYRWDAFEPAGGWRLQLVVYNRDERYAWALNAADDDNS